jgi:hypothetical protein
VPHPATSFCIPVLAHTENSRVYEVNVTMYELFLPKCKVRNTRQNSCFMYLFPILRNRTLVHFPSPCLHHLTKLWLLPNVHLTKEQVVNAEKCSLLPYILNIVSLITPTLHFLSLSFIKNMNTYLKENNEIFEQILSIMSPENCNRISSAAKDLFFHMVNIRLSVS